MVVGMVRTTRRAFKEERFRAWIIRIGEGAPALGGLEALSSY
jgi:hypothetical protein